MKNSQAGFASIITILIILFLIIGIGIGADLAYIEYLVRCGDTPVKQCLNENKEEEIIEENEEVVTATGAINAEQGSVSLTMNIPLGGGAVTGQFSGKCNGNITANFAGGDNGAISGTAHGSCSTDLLPVPVSATFNGTVNKEGKIVPVNGTASVLGFSGSKSVTLSY